jgi:hypothetical protein
MVALYISAISLQQFFTVKFLTDVPSMLHEQPQTICEVEADVFL